MDDMRLESTLAKLRNGHLVKEYEAVFQEWLKDEIIEEVQLDKWDFGHYLPHRAVVKEASTTRIRPVFDASSKEKGKPSLNMCLEKGESYVELIPSILLRFRLNAIGVIPDIGKAFLQISVSEKDRDSLRFLWKDEVGEMKIYRHRRVVFGVTSSPYLLGAVIDHHLSKCEEKVASKEVPYERSVISQLRKCLYVDNCVTSVDDEKELLSFMSQAREIFMKACFDLRGWEWSDPDCAAHTSFPVLGLLWDKKEDILRLNPPKPLESDAITRQTVMSAAHRIFDPLGVCAPAILIPRLLVQESWGEAGNWDTPFNEQSQATFRKWMSQADVLNQIEVPRWLKLTVGNVSLHTFCDASQVAYATISFLRVETDNTVSVIMVGAKVRVAPVKRPTIPRLELLAATIGARMASSIVKEIGDVECHFWSDSSTALCWIKKEEPWGVFVFNRVKEIRSLTDPDTWKHVPGVMNPADLPSRGCFPEELLDSKWWEGPRWLYGPRSEWPNCDVPPDENEVQMERRKTPLISALSQEPGVFCCERLARYFSSYHRIVRMVAWMIRLLWNKYSKKEKRSGELSLSEIARAEKVVLKSIQDEAFEGLGDKQLKNLKPHKDKVGLMRLRTRIWARKDPEDFRAPYILPFQHVIVDRLIHDLHTQNGHIGGQGLLNLLRERFWIVRGRQAVRRIVSACVICRRYRAKALEVESPPLPENRVRDARVFEISGTDFAGPLYLKNGDKVWVCIFTCAVYRVTHLELVTAMSTEAFIMAFRRFIARWGRPSFMYSDNGTNYKGFKNALDGIDWQRVASRGLVNQIEWRFNPPTATWWGGFWERLIGILKVHLRKILGRASLTFEELNTVISECTAYINSRPITYTSDDPSDPVPITPQMFIGDIQEMGVPDLDEVDAKSLHKRVRRRQEIRDNLKQRFRSEYLGQMFMTASNLKNPREPKVGEIVLIGADNQKRMHWPMAVVEELILGVDGRCRVVKLRTQDGQLTRPVQRVFPLEIPLEEEMDQGQLLAEVEPESDSGGSATGGSLVDSQVKVVASPPQIQEAQPINSEDPLMKFHHVETRCGRKVKVPSRFS
ncbi:uncharacterized protein LOC130897595 [Diorhabda carinulata]|uniref:uncharacterized protein LOC130897595 n=1 Tax=Diorhabda carinulata TaxID=1163345 RepID=UPI00259FF623|nr:uncharacterized protein LOC130897595 [Diorhabda carinulata]